MDEQIFYQFIMYFLGFQICIFKEKKISGFVIELSWRDVFIGT